LSASIFSTSRDIDDVIPEIPDLSIVSDIPLLIPMGEECVGSNDMPESDLAVPFHEVPLSSLDIRVPEFSLPLVPVVPYLPQPILPPALASIVPMSLPSYCPPVSIPTPATALSQPILPVSFVNMDPDSPSTPYSETNSLDERAVMPSQKKKRLSQTTISPVVADEELDSDQLAKRMRRRQRNKESAQQSRQRKKHFMDELTHQVQNLTSDNTTLQAQLRDALAQNEILKRTLHTNGIPLPQLSHRPSTIFTNNNMLHNLASVQQRL
jgi:hypothetical protein